MAKVFIVYASTTGNTEYVSEVVERVLGENGAEVKRVPAGELDDLKGLFGGYDLILFGCSSWGDESDPEVNELQEDFIPIYEQLGNAGLKGKKTAVFGCGDSSYEHFCGAVDLIEQRLTELGADVLDDLRIDGEPHPETGEIENWAADIAKKL